VNLYESSIICMSVHLSCHLYLCLRLSVTSFIFVCPSVCLSCQWMEHCWDVLMKLLHGSNWSDPSSGEKTTRCVYACSITFTLYLFSKCPSILTIHPSPTRFFSVWVDLPKFLVNNQINTKKHILWKRQVALCMPWCWIFRVAGKQASPQTPTPL